MLRPSSTFAAPSTVYQSFGDRDATMVWPLRTTGEVYVNWSFVEVAVVPAGVVTVMCTVPTALADDVAVICVALLTVKLVAFVLPNFTVVAPMKFVPVIVTLVPPVVGP